MSFPKLPFLEIFKDASGGNIKTPQKDFLDNGNIPVVDQGQQLIAGYVNERERVCKTTPPVIIFGDHTRAIKYVDFEFAMGADGTKVLVPKGEGDTKFFFYALRALNIPNAGYSRHYKFLKKSEIPFPPLDEQKRIAKILDAADALRAKRREALAQLDTFLQSTFLDMFGDPVANPMGWEVKPLGELGTLNRGISKHRPRNEPSLLGGPHPLIQTGEVAKSGGYIRSYTSTYSDLGLKQSKMWSTGTLCITIAANIANTGILTFDACFPDSVVGFLSEEAGRAEYVQGLFWFFKDILDRKAPQVAQKNINLKILRDLPVPLPPTDLQHRFAAIVKSVEQQKSRMKTHLTELDTLFASLQQRAFNGEL
ncbi:Type I restriction enzyme S subunit [Candidatus Electrothrix laxa]